MKVNEHFTEDIKKMSTFELSGILGIAYTAEAEHKKALKDDRYELAKMGAIKDKQIIRSFENIADRSRFFHNAGVAIENELIRRYAAEETP